MNKAVHALVYVILAVAGVALYFEMNLFEKKELLKDSNEQLRNCIVKLSSFIEAEDAPAAKPIEVGIDKEPCEAREVDDPQLTQLLDDYHPEYEKANLTLLKWGDAQAVQLRKLYDLDADGNKKPDPATPGKFISKGPGTAQELVDKITERASKQNEVLNKTRNELANLRGKLQSLAGEYNKLPKEVRLGKMELEKKEKELEKLTTEKAAVEDQLQKSKGEVEELKTGLRRQGRDGGREGGPQQGEGDGCASDEHAQDAVCTSCRRFRFLRGRWPDDEWRQGQYLGRGQREVVCRREVRRRGS